MKRIFRYISYTLMYLIISIASAYGVILLSMNNTSKDQASNASMPPQISNMINSITQSSNLDIDLNLNLSATGTNANININALLDLSQGFDNLAVQGQIAGTINEQELIVNLIYKDSIVYVEAFNNKFMLESSNIMESISEILSMLNFEMPSLGIDLSSLDLNMIGSMLSNLTETIEENSILLSIEVPVVGKLEIVTDKKYRPISINLPQTQIDTSTSFSVNGNIEYPENFNFDEINSQDYIDLTSIINLAKAGLNFINQDNITLKSNILLENQSLDFDLTIDLKNYNLLISTILGNNKANLIFKDKTIFFDYQNVFVKFDLNEIDTLANLITKYFNIELPVELIENILNSIDSKNIMQIFDINRFPVINLQDIDLSIIEKFSVENNIYTLQIKNIGAFNISTQEDTLSSICFENETVKCSFESVESVEIPALNENKYAELSLLISTFDNVLDIVSSNSINGTFGLSYQDLSLSGEYKISFKNNNIVAFFTITIFEQTIDLIYTNNTIYIQYGEIKIKVSLENIDEVLTFLQNNFNLNLNTDELSSIIKKLSEQLNIEKYPSLITGLNKNENALFISLANGLNLNIVNTEKSLNLRIDCLDLQFIGSLNGSEEIIETPVIDDSNFVTEQNLLNLASNIIDYINSKEYFAEINVKYQDLIAKAYVSYQNNLEVKATLTYNSNTFDIAIIADENFNFDLYITNQKIAIKASIESLKELAETVTKFLGIDLQAEIENILSQFENSTSNINLSMLTKLKITEFSKDIISINYDNINASINFKNDFVDNITISMDDLNGSINLLNEKPNTEPVVVNYQDLATLSEKVTAVLDTLLSNKGNIELSLDNVVDNVLTNYQAQAQYDLASTNALRATISQNIENGFKVNAGVFDNYVYVDYSDLRVKMEYTSLIEIANKILPMLGIEQTVEEILETLDIGKILGDLASSAQSPDVDINQVFEMINYVENFTCNQNQLAVTLNSKMFGIENGNMVEISVTFNENKISNVLIKNMYTGNNAASYINLNVVFFTFNGVEQFEDMTNFMDLTPLKNVLLSAINMTELRNFKIQGSANISILGINMNVPYTIEISLEDLNNPLIYAKIGKIPVFPAVNDDVAGARERMLYVYYTNGYVYMHRTEKILKTHEKKIKVSLDTFMSDPLHYILSWGLGMKSYIMDEIYAAIEKSQNRPTPINFGNVLLGVNCDETNKVYGLTLNLREIAYNDMMDKMTVGLGIINNAETNYKDYIGTINFAMNMPFTESLVMNLSTTDTRLVEIGQKLDMTKVDNFANSYTHPEGQTWEDSHW